jgi:hypothetical protein
VVHLINQTSENTARVRLPRKAKTDTNYAERKVRSGDVVDSDGSQYSPQSEVSDVDQDKDKKPKAVKTKSPSQKQPANDIVDGDEEEDEEEEVSIIGL